jgi:hypothetical protein
MSICSHNTFDWRLFRTFCCSQQYCSFKDEILFIKNDFQFVFIDENYTLIEFFLTFLLGAVKFHDVNIVMKNSSKCSTEELSFHNSSSKFYLRSHKSALLMLFSLVTQNSFFDIPTLFNCVAHQPPSDLIFRWFSEQVSAIIQLVRSWKRRTFLRILISNLFCSVTIGDRVVVIGLLKCEDVFLQNGSRLFAQIYLEANNIFPFDQETLFIPVKSTITTTKHIDRLGSNLFAFFSYG